MVKEGNAFDTRTDASKVAIDKAFYVKLVAVMLGLGLFVLSGAFWEKLCALFVHGATAVVPGDPGTVG